MTVRLAKPSARQVSAGNVDIVVDFTGEFRRRPDDVYVIDGTDPAPSYMDFLVEAEISGGRIDLVYDTADQKRQASDMDSTIRHRASGLSHRRLISTIDLVVLTIIDNRLHVGLTLRTKHPFRGHRALPGGFIHLDEDGSTLDAAHRVATVFGVSPCHIEQVETIAGPARDPRGQNGWAMSVLHLAVLHPGHIAGAASSIAFVPVDTVSGLAFDHDRMLAIATERFIAKARYSTLLVHAMPETFLMPALIDAYRSICSPALDQSSFGRKIAERKVLKQVGLAPGKGSAGIMTLASKNLIVFDKPILG